MDESDLAFRAVERLHQRGRASQGDGLRKGHIKDADQDEQKVHRHRAVDSRENNLQPRRYHGNKNIENESPKIARVPLGKREAGDSSPDCHAAADKEFSFQVHKYLSYQAKCGTCSAKQIGVRVTSAEYWNRRCTVLPPGWK